MLLLSKNNSLHDDIRHWQNKDSEQYQQMLHAHNQNAITKVESMGLLYDAIQLARFSDANQWIWQKNQAETHPALLTLCAFWQSFREDESVHEARIPYIQLFLGQENYVPLIPSVVSMPTIIENDQLRNTIRESSVIFGEHFFITFLASRRISASKSDLPSLVHYTVQNKPLLRENLLYNKQDMTISCQTLKGLYEFPKRFPSLWQYLIKQREVTHYEIH